LKRSQNGLVAAKSALATLLDREGDFDIALPAEPVLPAEPSTLTDGALRDRPDVQAARASLALAEAQRGGTWFKYLPNVGLTAAYRIANSTGFTGTNDSWAVGLGASWTIWMAAIERSSFVKMRSK